MALDFFDAAGQFPWRDVSSELETEMAWVVTLFAVLA